MSQFDEDAEENGYFSETLDGSELTGLEPKFYAIPSLTIDPRTLSEMKVDDLIGLYIDVRNQLATDRHGYDAREARVKAHLQIISMILRDRGDSAGVDSFSTAKGTAYRNVKEKFQIADWDALVNYVKESQNFQVFQRRVTSTAVREIREQDGDLPPGVGAFTEVEFSVRSPTVRKSRK